MENKQIRKNGIYVLSILTDTDTAKKLENAAWNEYGNKEKNYIKCIYQIYGDLSKNKKAYVILDQIKKYNWNHETYADEKAKQDEQDDFIENPFEIEEGVIECKCGSKRVFSYSKQTRSADEPMTTYAECVECSSKWTYSG